MHGPHLSYTKWVFAIYLHLTSIKGVSSMKLHRDLGITQKTVWFLLHRIQGAWTEDELKQFVAVRSRSMRRTWADWRRTSPTTRSGAPSGRPGQRQVNSRRCP